MSEIINFKNVSYEYRSGENFHRGVIGLNFSIQEGEFIAILGHNGSGKSTLSKLINGFLKATFGEVNVLGINPSDDRRIYELRSQVGMVFQNPDNQMVATMIEDDLAFGPENLGIPREEITERIDWALDIVDMKEYKNKMPNKLSGGQKQRIAIAAILSMRPKILILDESTAMLDPKGRKEVMATIKKLNKEQGLTVILITHYMDEAVEADRVFVLNQGVITVEGTPAEVFKEVRKVRDAGLELPIPSQVCIELISKGYDIPFVLTDEDLVDALIEQKQRKSKQKPGFKFK
ncbi:MAG: energy-coupling factor transporter ATPase [Christensenellales bacterium]|jgi:energy-coupling factor transport system ATP-binding protein|nr:energy-coupling factor transporter ATPase [Clostridiales bacterium]